MLIRLYDSEGDTEKIKELLDNCTSEELKEKYSSYIAEKQFSAWWQESYNDRKNWTLAPS